MKNNRPLSIIGLLSFILIVLYSIQLKSKVVRLEADLKETQQNKTSNNSFESGLLDNSYELQKLSWVHSISGVDNEILLKDNQAIEYQLVNKLNGFTLLFTFNSNMSEPCIDREIENMIKLI